MSKTLHIDQQSKGNDPRHLMGMVTHHKCGTIWMKRILRDMSAKWDIPMVGMWSKFALNRLPKTGSAFVVNWSGWFPEDLWQMLEFRSVHLIRDPRDVLLSGCQYHHFAPKGGEAFLYEPRDDLNGLSYQNHLCQLESYEEKLLFEMREKHAQTVAEMVAISTADAAILQLRYEDVIQDEKMTTFDTVLRHWRLKENRTEEAHQIIWNNSLFGRLASPGERDGRISMHVLSGASVRWDKELPRAIGEIYAQEFGDALIALGYEKDHSWVSRLPVDPVPFNLEEADDEPPSYIQ